MNESGRIASLMVRLMTKQNWLSDHSEALVELLSNFCTSLEQVELVTELLYDFEYFNTDETNKLLKEAVKAIADCQGLSDSNTIIAGMAGDRYADSSQYFLYGAKPIFSKIGWGDIKLVNTYRKIYDECKSSNWVRLNVVLFDEFLGSGRTALNRIKEIKSQFDSSPVAQQVNIKVFCLFSSVVGFNVLRENNVDINTRVILKRGIRDKYAHLTAIEKIEIMLSLEGMLLPTYNSRVLPSLGYGETETLFARKDGNSPNSVFPIFWWKFMADRRKRNTLLERLMSDA